MSAQSSPTPVPPLDLARWRHVPTWCLVGGGALALLGLILRPVQFGYSWLVAFMFFLSIGLGGMFLVLMHHLFDAGWSVPIRRFCEHLACLTSPAMAVLFLPLAALAPWLYPWMEAARQHRADHALHAKYPLFTVPMFYLVAALCFGLWWLISSRLRGWSLRQDTTGGADCTFALRRWSAVGIFVFAVTLTLAAILWLKALQHQWFSTMYGVYYFAGSVWLTLANVYVITMVLDRIGLLRGRLHEHQYYFIGTLLFAFTVFYAYIHFSQYFIIWNANVPEETFWYKLRERGSWNGVGLLLIFGHFVVPFLALLRIDAKHLFPLMTGICGLAWVMHYLDLAFNVMPIPHPEGFPWQWLWLDLACLAFIGGVLTRLFLRRLNAHPPLPIRDPRLGEAMGQFHPVASPISGGEMDETEGVEAHLEARVHPAPGGSGGGR